MKRETYYRGTPGKKWGIWNAARKAFQFNICEDTPMLAEARLFQKIGDDARKYRFEPRMLPSSVARESDGILAEPEDGWDLFNAKPGCKHEVVPVLSGGVRCRKCGGWFAF